MGNNVLLRKPLLLSDVDNNVNCINYDLLLLLNIFCYLFLKNYNNLVRT